MNKDLTYILDGKTPRLYGEIPSQIGNYEMIAPSPLVNKLQKAINGNNNGRAMTQ
jgi:hypothetical protein